MSRRYRISPEGRGPLSDAEVARHADATRLLYNYHRATRPLYARPLYKNPKVFIALVILVLLALLVSEALGPDSPAPLDPRERVTP